MLTITVAGTEMYDDETQEFSIVDGVKLELEHSLVSLSKWEQIFEKPFLGEYERTEEEIVGYVKAMTLTPGIPEEVFSKLSTENYEQVNAYLEAKMSATWFNDSKSGPRSSEALTSELIYYWMIMFKIPFECQTWHLNRLFTLIQVCNIKQSPPKKMSRAALAARNRELNERRKQQLQTKG